MAELYRDQVVPMAPSPARVRIPVRDPFTHDVHELSTFSLLVTPHDPTHLGLRSPLKSLGAARQARSSKATTDSSNTMYPLHLFMIDRR